MPVAFCLLPNRRATTYVELLRRFKAEATRLGHHFEPKHVVSDFESAIMSAVRQEVSLYLFAIEVAGVLSFLCSSFQILFIRGAFFTSRKAFIVKL